MDHSQDLWRSIYDQTTDATPEREDEAQMPLNERGPGRATRKQAAHRTTISDVARAAGVSNTTVSFVLNGRPGVSAATRDRILAVTADLGWVPSAHARALGGARTMTIGMVSARDAEVFSADPF